jgi:hypothetical protein
MQRTRMPATEWDRELIADLVAEHARLARVVTDVCFPGRRPARLAKSQAIG